MCLNLTDSNERRLLPFQTIEVLHAQSDVLTQPSHSNSTVEPLISHTPRWIARAMGYERLWVLRGRFGCKFQFGSGLNLWGMGDYGLWEVWIMRVSTVFPTYKLHRDNPSHKFRHHTMNIKEALWPKARASIESRPSQGAGELLLTDVDNSLNLVG